MQTGIVTYWFSNIEGTIMLLHRIEHKSIIHWQLYVDIKFFLNIVNAYLESLECKGHWIPNNFRRAGGRRFGSVRVDSSTGGVWCLPPDEARVPLLRRRRRRLSTKTKLSPFRIIYDDRRVDFSSPCLCRIKSAVRKVWIFWYSASGGAVAVTSWLVPLPSLFLREEWRPTRRQTFSMNLYLLSSHYYSYHFRETIHCLVHYPQTEHI